jgi:hypothetical protein
MDDLELVNAVYEEVELDSGRFTAWEIDFIARMSEVVGSGHLLSPRQREKLEEIQEERVE